MTFYHPGETPEELVAEAREAIARINPESHDALFQYRGGVMWRGVEKILADVTDALEAALALSPAPLVIDEVRPRRRLRACVEAWPDCETGDYNPSCCRFPKSCSADIYDPDRISTEDLEPSTEEERGGGR